MKKIINLIFLSLLLCGLTQAQRLPEFEKAREIKLLEMNRDDVRKIFADYKLDDENSSDYKDLFLSENAEIEVSYSDGGCSDDSVDWESTEWKVEEIEITFKNHISLKENKISFSKYRKERTLVNVSDSFIYHNKNLGLAYWTSKGEIWRIHLLPSAKNSELLCNNEESKNYYSKKNWFNNELKDRIYCPPNLPANIVNLILDSPEITASCDSSDKRCSDSIQSVAVYSVHKDPENDVVTFSYDISGGKIIGYGKRVVWNLSGVKPGTYTITAAVDDGCGFCGKSMKKTVIVKQCSDCLDK